MAETRPYQVLYRKTPAWLLGETELAAVVRRRFPDVTSVEGRYPDDYPGRVISVRPAGHPWSAKDTADPGRARARLSLTKAEVRGLRSRDLKLNGSEKPVPVQLGDRYGATGAELFREYPTEVAGLPDDDERRLAFDRRAVELRRALPKTIVHSGAGLYEVKAGEYTTIQSALDQLWTDQGSAAFTASQYIRIFADSYAENIVPNAALNPDEASGYLFILEGDPTADRDTIMIAPVGGSYTLYANCDQILVRHLKIAGTPTVYMFRMDTGCSWPAFIDCTITGAKLGRIYQPGWFEDCNFVQSTTSHCLYTAHSNGAAVVRRCTFTGVGKATSTGAAIYSHNAAGSEIIQQCSISGFRYAFRLGTNIMRASTNIINNVIHDCTYGAWYGAQVAFLRRRFFNNIFEDVDYPICVREWPEETATQMGDRYVLRNNCYHGYTAFAYGPAAATKTYGEFCAYGQVDAAGDLDATDPGLTDAPGGDFNLTAGSACRRRGVGSGGGDDVDGNAFCPHHPDIGSHSTGTSTAAPGISTVVPSSSSIVVTVTAGGGPREVAVIVDSAGTEIDRQSRLGAGSITLTPSASGKHFLAVYPADAGDGVIGEAGIWAKAVIVPSATETEWKQAVAAIAAEIDDYTSIKVVIPNQRFDPKTETEFIELGRPSFQGGGGRRGERLSPVAVEVWCVAKVGGDSRNLGRALDIADVVEAALGEADIEVQSGRWLILRKAAVTSEGEAEYQGAMVQVARVAVEGIYQRTRS